MAAITTSALVGGGLSAASAGMSFAQAAKQNKLQKKAEREAQKYVAEAKRQAELNPFEAIAIQTEPYELEREAALQQAAAMTQAIREGDQRGVVSGVGQVQDALQKQQAQTRASMAQDLFNLESITAQQDAANAATLGNIALNQATGAQVAAAQAEEAKNAAITGGFSSLGSAATTAIKGMELYGQNKKSKMVSELSDKINSRGVDIGAISRVTGKTPQEIFTMNEVLRGDLLQSLDEGVLEAILKGQIKGPVQAPTIEIPTASIGTIDFNPFQ